MQTTTSNDKEAPLDERQIEICRKIPGFYLNKGIPCTCGADKLQTKKKVGYSETVTYYHRCSDCGNEFSTYIEG